MVKKCSCGCEMPTKFSIGQRFHINLDDELNEYLLCSVNGLCGLVNINNGNSRNIFIRTESFCNIKLEEFCKMFHDGVLYCSKCKTPYKEIIKYKIGQKFRPVNTYSCDDNTFILARSKWNEIVLICLEDGDRWSNAVEVESINNITEDDFKKICRQSTYKFELIED